MFDLTTVLEPVYTGSFFYQYITHGFIRAYRIIAEVIVHYHGFGLFAVSQGGCFQNTHGTTVTSVKNLRALLSHRWFARATPEGMADAASFK